MSLYDKDDPQAWEYERYWERANDRYNRRTDPLKWLWERGLRALEELRRDNRA